MLSERTAYFGRLRSELHLGGAEDEVLRELADHVDDVVEDLVREGVSPARASAIAIGQLGRPQTLAHLLRQAHFVARWHETLLGAAPMLLVAALIGLRLWQWPIAAALAAIIIVSVTLYGLWRGRPAWFYPWAGVALTFPLVAGYVAFELVRSGPLPYERAGLDVTLLGFFGGLLYFPVGLLVVSGAVLVAVRRDWLDASILLSPLPLGLVWIVAVHRAGGLLGADGSLDGTSQLLAIICLCMASTIVAIMRARRRALKVALLVCAAVLLITMADMAGSTSPPIVTVARAAILVGFLLSPALVARRLGSI